MNLHPFRPRQLREGTLRVGPGGPFGPEALNALIPARSDEIKGMLYRSGLNRSVRVSGRQANALSTMALRDPSVASSACFSGRVSGFCHDGELARR